MNGAEKTEVIQYSTRSDRNAAWLAVLFGYFGFLDFYTGHPVKGIVKLVLTFSCVGIVVTFFWNLYDLYQISCGKYYDGNQLAIKKESRDAQVLFWVCAVLTILALIFEVFIVFSLISFLGSVVVNVAGSAAAIGGAATAISGAAHAVSGTADAVSSTVSSYESQTLIQNILHVINSFFE